MSETPVNDERRRATGLRRHVAGMIALVALFVMVAAWFWKSQQGMQAEPGVGLPHGVIIAGAVTFVTALIAQIRAMSLGEILEAAWELLLGLFGLIGAVLKGIVNWFLGMLGWD
jgi:hypothetical protein